MNMLHISKHLINSGKRFSSTKPVSKTKQYASTVLLPQTNFPLRLGKNLLQRDVTINNSDEFQNLYNWQRQRDTLEFILHDGPPYANGALHMGHAINKILKDAILRYNLLQGYKVHYVPGWDCHGLPIELKVTSSNTSLNPLQIRQEARKFARKAIEQQTKTFLSWGIMGDWENSYLTFNESYIKNQMMQFCSLYERELVYRDVKPVFWSPSAKTALAEAELVYVPNHKSRAVTVQFPVNDVPYLNIERYLKVSALIWTTTPWTLPSNQAISYNPDLQYCLVSTNDDSTAYIVASDLVSSLSEALNCGLKVMETFSGNCLEGATYHHPILKDKLLPFLPSSHATSTKGTGLVHTAPAHGPEDYLVALQNKIKPTSIVDEAGQYTCAAGHELTGKYVLKEGTEEVIKILKEHVIKEEDYIHSYPYDWRTNEPVILRASDQWFVDTEQLKENAIKALEDVRIFPEANKEVYKNILIGQLKKRPYWCISRQRSWGTPIPVFYEKESGKPIVNRDVVLHLNSLLDKFGPDFWWELPIEQLVPNDFFKGRWLTPDDIRKGEDIFDIWFDSGISWSAVLKESQVADMYLEGVDQFTGWFQSSLLLSIALRDTAPYKQIYVHGYAVDSNGEKMSKSIGNVIDPNDITLGSKNKKPYGVDVLRWWVTCHANRDSLAAVSETTLDACTNEIQKIRAVMRFILGNLSDYKEKQLYSGSLMLSDRYLLHLLWKFNYEVLQSMKDYHFHKVSALLINFLTNPVSSLYFTTIKDRLYCDSVHSSRRRSAQYVLHQIINAVLQIIYPMVPHLAQELYEYLPQKTTCSYFKRERFVTDSNWKDETVENVMALVLKIKGEINGEFGAETGTLSVCIQLSDENYERFIAFASKEALEMELTDILQVSSVTLNKSETTTDYTCETKLTDLHICYRCRRHISQQNEELCPRCYSIVENCYKAAMKN